jgi:hypothetical protein
MMRPEQLQQLESFGQIEEVRRVQARVEAAEKRLERARRELSPAESETSRRKEYRGGRDVAAREILDESRAVLRAAKEERRRIENRVWEEVEPALREEHRRRLKETADAVAKAIEANRRLHEVGRKAEELRPPNKVCKGALLFDCCWADLNRERFEDWLHFVSLSGLLDESELREAAELDR